MSLKNNFKNIEKDNLVGIIGVLLIIGIAAFTLFKNDKKDVDLEKLQQAIRENQIDYETFSVSDLKSTLKSPMKKNYFLLDIRDEQNFTQKHIVDSINIPANLIAEGSLAEKINKNQTIIIITQNGIDAQLQSVLRYLKNNNFTNYFVLENGIDGWEKDYGQTVSLGNPTSFVDQAKVKYTTTNELRDRLNKKDLLFIIDLRDQASFDKEHIPGAINIPLGKLEISRKKIPHFLDVIVYSDTPLASFQAASMLFDLYFGNVYALQEGFTKW